MDEIRSATAEQKPSALQPKSDRSQRSSSRATTHVLLRSLAAMATLAAVLTIFFDEETEVIAGFSMHASYKSSPTFKFFLIGNAVACVYSLVSILFTFCNGTSCLVRMLDLMTMALVMASASAASAIGYTAKYGNQETGWVKVCNYYERFCNRAEISMACSYVGFLLLFLVCSLPSVNKAKQRKNPNP